MAGNKKGRQYHRPPAQKAIMQRPVRLSQCMIVKNEEKNIKKALSWAKGHAFEQIVVDTGSTDKTVEIAKRMGAKVYHFEWINDFSAAKNYAIEQAKGNWIAFLDADEYFSNEDAKKLMNYLLQIENDPKLGKMKTAITCPIVNLDDEGKPFLAVTQNRVFRNTPEIRYIGSIHEYLDLNEKTLSIADLTVIHTGYAQSVYDNTDKAERNVKLIREELSKNPESADLKSYLADSLRAMGGEDNMAEAEVLFWDVLSSEQEMLPELKQRAYNHLIVTYYDNEEKNAENLAMCRRAYEEFPKNPDFCYFYGKKLHISGDFASAWEKLSECENLLKGDSVGLAGHIIKNPMLLFFQMVLAAEELGNVEEVIRCATLVLREDKYQPLMLAPYIQAFNRSGYKASTDEILALLGKIYDLNNTKDKITVMRGAKDAGNTELVGKALALFTSDELSWLAADFV